MSRQSKRKAQLKRQEQKRRAANQVRLGVESLEMRSLLASVPMAAPHYDYATALNTDLVITSSSGTHLLSGALDVDGASLASAVVGSPSHGSIISSGSDGSFSYRPTTGYSGLDSFTYKVSNASEDSPLA